LARANKQEPPRGRPANFVAIRDAEAGVFHRQAARGLAMKTGPRNSSLSSLASRPASLVKPSGMDSEAFIRWALDKARTVEERYTTELLVEQGVSWWNSRRQIYQREGYEARRERQRQLGCAGE